MNRENFEVRAAEHLVEVNVFFHAHDGDGNNVGGYLHLIKSQTEGLQLADQIRNATLAVWPVTIEPDIEESGLHTRQSDDSVEAGNEVA